MGGGPQRARLGESSMQAIDPNDNRYVAMKITFWGTRGSLAKPGPDTARYGGNTACVEVRTSSGTLLVIDCGTGGHSLGQRLVRNAKGPVDGHLLIGHTHWDHIQGIPFFAPLFIRGNSWDIYGPKGLSQSVKAALAGQMEHTYFPVALEHLGATIRYHDLVEGVFSVGDVRISTRYLNHPALTLGYRLDADGAIIAYCSDHEPHSAALASGTSAITGIDRQYADFIAGADLVIHDGQYVAAEYAAKQGWGHSTVEYAVRVCREAGVRRVALTHHDPLRTDDAIDRIVGDLRSALREEGASIEVFGAAEGLTVELAGEAGRGALPVRNEFFADTAFDKSSFARPVILSVLDPLLLEQLRVAVMSEGLPCVVVAPGEDLAHCIARDKPTLVMIEHHPPMTDGEAAARAVRAVEVDGEVRAPIVLVTSGERPAILNRGVATDWLTAPFTLSYARTKIRAWALRAASRWIRAKVPVGEMRRLAALRALSILDTPPEERFDRLTRIACAAFDVPVALVSLVDGERQWFKSCVGLEVDETSRDLAFCSHVVHSSEELVVPDTLLDERFADNPLVVEAPRLRFYAGAPLILGDGECIGTLCIADTRPRDFSEAGMATLRDLRDLAIEEVQRKRQ